MKLQNMLKMTFIILNDKDAAEECIGVCKGGDVYIYICITIVFLL
jgi:hypothetical protein